MNDAAVWKININDWSRFYINKYSKREDSNLYQLKRKLIFYLNFFFRMAIL